MSAKNINNKSITVQVKAGSGNDITRRRAVKFTNSVDIGGSRQIAVTKFTAATDVPAGIAQVDVTAAEAKAISIDVMAKGSVVKIMSGEAIDPETNAAPLKFDASGRVINQGGSGTIIGYAETKVSAADQSVVVRIV